ncbi:hypothetical protein [Brachybacterium sp. AOP24-D1-21]|uniref:hypothetical protein n=1 Tax=Brachybacterium sp. AOP24-D1-21 TaxID=3457711 RepID=UPI0040341C21
MKPGDRIAFTWQPEEPVEAFECMLVTNRKSLTDRAFAVAVTAFDAAGDRVLPREGAWFHSDLLGTHCQYTRETEPFSAARLQPWTGTAIAQVFQIEAVAWPSGGDDIPEIIALGVSAVPPAATTARNWQLVHPQEGDDA